jgi:hypothetical protein
VLQPICNGVIQTAPPAGTGTKSPCVAPAPRKWSHLEMMVSLSTLRTLCYCCPCRLVSPFAYSVCSLWMVTTELSLLVTLQVVTVAHYSCWQPIADGAIVSSFTLIFWQAEIAGGPEQWLQSAPKLLQTLISKVRMSCCFPAVNPLSCCWNELLRISWCQVVFHTERPENRRYARAAPTDDQERPRMVRIRIRAVRGL